RTRLPRLSTPWSCTPLTTVTPPFHITSPVVLPLVLTYSLIFFDSVFEPIGMPIVPNIVSGCSILKLFPQCINTSSPQILSCKIEAASCVVVSSPSRGSSLQPGCSVPPQLAHSGSPFSERGELLTSVHGVYSSLPASAAANIDTAIAPLVKNIARLLSNSEQQQRDLRHKVDSLQRDLSVLRTEHQHTVSKIVDAARYQMENMAHQLGQLMDTPPLKQQPPDTFDSQGYSHNVSSQLPPTDATNFEQFSVASNPLPAIAFNLTADAPNHKNDDDLNIASVHLQGEPLTDPHAAHVRDEYPDAIAVPVLTVPLDADDATNLQQFSVASNPLPANAFNLTADAPHHTSDDDHDIASVHLQGVPLTDPHAAHVLDEYPDAIAEPVSTVPLDADAAQPCAPASIDTLQYRIQELINNNGNIGYRSAHKKLNSDERFPKVSLKKVQSALQTFRQQQEDLAAEADTTGISPVPPGAPYRLEHLIEDITTLDDLYTLAQYYGYLDSDSDGDSTASDWSPAAWADNFDEHLATSDSENGDHLSSDLHSADKKYHRYGAASP
ncbi:unnamed protein product, partial [Prorocentrum cordatum]